MADDSRLSSVIDEDGQLFGLINVIDALVILLVIAIVGTGIALVGPSGGPAETRYATIDFGPQPAYTANQITEGDQWAPQGGSGLTIREVFISPGADGERHVIARAAVNGTAIDPEASDQGTIRFAGEPLRFGRVMEVETTEYVVEGTVTDVSLEENVGTEASRTVTVRLSEIPQQRAERLGVGMSEVLGNDETATVTVVDVQPTEVIRSSGSGFEVVEHPRNRDVTLTLDLNVREQQDGTVLFRGQRLRGDQQLTLDLGGITVTGEVTSIT